MFSSFFSGLLVICAVVVAITAAPSSSACTGTISSVGDVTSAVKCTTVNINAFTVPAGQTFELNLLAGTTVNMRASHSYTSLHPCFTMTNRQWVMLPLAMKRGPVLSSKSGKLPLTFGYFYYAILIHFAPVSGTGITCNVVFGDVLRVVWLI